MQGNSDENELPSLRADQLSPVKLRRVEKFIHEHLSDQITLKQLATVACYSPSRFLLLFRNATGHSPHQYVMLQRLERARALVLNTDFTLVDVASSCGFADQSHLIRLFKRHTGMTPNKLRQTKHQAPSGINNIYHYIRNDTGMQSTG